MSMSTSKVLIDRDDWLRLTSGSHAQEEETKDVAVLPVPRPLLVRAHPAMARGLKVNKPIQAWLSYYTGATGAANTAFSAGFTLTPNQDTSWASWQAVFDEVKVLEATIMWNAYYITAPSAVPANAPNAIMVYDPTSSVTLASVNAGMQFEKFDLMRIMYPTSAGPLVTPMNFSKGGYQRFTAKVPKGVVESQTQTLNSPGLWRPTADAVNYEWGTFSAYCAVGGTTSQIRLEGFVRMKVEFRTRR